MFQDVRNLSIFGKLVKQITLDDGGVVYQKLNQEYINLTSLYCGGDSYIELPSTFIPDSQSRIVGSFRSVIGEVGFIFGSRRTSSSDIFAMYINIEDESNTRFSTGIGTGNWKGIDVAIDATNWVDFDVDISGTLLTDITGKQTMLSNLNQNDFTGISPVAIGKLTGNSATFMGWLKPQKIYQGDSLVFDLVIKKRVSDGVVGFYDTLTDIFYPSISQPFLEGVEETNYPTFGIENNELIQSTLDNTLYSNFAIENNELIVNYEITQNEPQLVIENDELFEIIE